MAEVTITQFTDPACTWCWGSEPVMRRIKEVYAGEVEMEFVMGGLVEDFDSFADPANGIEEPGQVASHWRKAAETHRMPVDPSIWREDPPRSTYPANRAYRAAELQGQEKADRFLRRMREAVCAEAENIEREEVLGRLAEGCGLDRERLVDDMDSRTVEELFREDLELAEKKDVSGFPTFWISSGEEEVWLRGFNRFETFREAIEKVSDVEPGENPEVTDFIERYGKVATAEVFEVSDLDEAETLQKLRSLEREGRVRSLKTGNDYFWISE
ncbi:MAG: DsbA family protein [Candidatus Nanohaloarchaea archaeon]